jgi:CubicO group peptidase (beta-lactamase class C family)
MSKAFTGLAILKLRDEGKLSLDALAETYVPEMRGWRYPTADSPRIRVRDLLNHSGGLVTDDPWGDRQQVITRAEFTGMIASGVPFTRAPGTPLNIRTSAMPARPHNRQCLRAFL